jgi:hypothetical protein
METAFVRSIWWHDINKDTAIYKEWSNILEEIKGKPKICEICHAPANCIGRMNYLGSIRSVLMCYPCVNLFIQRLANEVMIRKGEMLWQTKVLCDLCGKKAKIRTECCTRKQNDYITTDTTKFVVLPTSTIYADFCLEHFRRFLTPARFIEIIKSG